MQTNLGGGAEHDFQEVFISLLTFDMTSINDYEKVVRICSHLHFVFFVQLANIKLAVKQEVKMENGKRLKKTESQFCTFSAVRDQSCGVLRLSFVMYDNRLLALVPAGSQFFACCILCCMLLCCDQHVAQSGCWAFSWWRFQDSLLGPADGFLHWLLPYKLVLDLVLVISMQSWLTLLIYLYVPLISFCRKYHSLMHQAGEDSLSTLV